MTLRELIIEGSDRLREAGIFEHENDAKVLAMDAFGLNYTEMLMKMADQMDEEKSEIFKEHIRLRATHMPCQYITGSQEFMGYEFAVREGVLIPRAETELLVERALQLTANREKVAALDMCTGSGCIGISYELMRREQGHAEDKVCLVDISDEAIAVAGENKQRLGASCDIIKSDLFDKINDRYDIIMSNPPYIRTADIDDIMVDVRDFEPVLALDGDADGLAFYRRLADEAKKYLNEDGIIIMEIGYDQYKDVRELLLEKDFHNINILNDYAGLDRVVTAYATEHDY